MCLRNSLPHDYSLHRIFRVIHLCTIECGVRNLPFFFLDVLGSYRNSCFTRDEIKSILAKVELASLIAQRSPVRVDEGFLRLVFRLTFQFVPLLKQRATTVIDGAGIGPHGLFFRRVAVFDLFDARLQRVIVIRFDRLASRFGNEFPFHGFRIVKGGREAVVFGHVVGFPRDFFFHLSVFFQDVRGHPRFRRGKFFVRPSRFERREGPAWHVKCGDARALVHTAEA